MSIIDFPPDGLANNIIRSRTTIRWCTPSVLPGPDLDPWRDDLSISYAPAGSMLDHSGWFRDSENRVARVQGCDRAFLMPAGSTTANLVVIRAIARHGLPGTVLVDRQAHHSVVRGLTMFQVPWQYIDLGRWDDTFECPRPVRPRDLAAAIRSVDKVAAVIVVSPSYGGEIADLAAMRAVIDREADGAVFHVDEAWGAHLAFHRDLASHRAARFAHVVSESTHKAGGALQPGAVLLWNDGPLPFDTVDAAYLDLMSTSASFIIAASIDHAYQRLRDDGDVLIDRSIALSHRLADGLRSSIPGARFLADGVRNGAVGQDPTKVTLALPPGPATGYRVRDVLAEGDIIVEKATPATVTFLATFGLDQAQVDTTIAATVDAVAALSADGGPSRRSVPDPFGGAPARPAVPPWEAQKAARFAAVDVVFDDAAGRVAAESVEAYPPGVAVISEGFEVTAGALEWLRVVKAAGGTIVARDSELGSLRVLGTVD